LFELLERFALRFACVIALSILQLLLRILHGLLGLFQTLGRAVGRFLRRRLVVRRFARLARLPRLAGLPRLTWFAVGWLAGRRLGVARLA
jgi:hypothetical protein